MHDMHVSSRFLITSQSKALAWSFVGIQITHRYLNTLRPQVMQRIGITLLYAARLVLADVFEGFLDSNIQLRSVPHLSYSPFGADMTVLSTNRTR